MSNKRLFKDGEANEWFRRNQELLEKRQINKPMSLLCDWLEPFSKEIEEVLEIGCGSGHNLKYLSERLGAVGYGAEPSAEAVGYISKAFPELITKVGFGDKVPFEKAFSLVHLGFYLYLVDREMYLSCVKEADRLVKPGGFLSIVDFDTPYPYSNRYAHKEGVFSHKQNNSDVFVASGLYSIVNKYHFSHEKFSFDRNVNERVSLTLLYKEDNIFGDTSV